jgi:hypothetical protein
MSSKGVAADVVEQSDDVGIAAVDVERVGAGTGIGALALLQPQGFDAVAAGGAGHPIETGFDGGEQL